MVNPYPKIHTIIAFVFANSTGINQLQYPMNMVRHDGVLVKNGIRKMFGDLPPIGMGDFSHLGQPQTWRRDNAARSIKVAARTAFFYRQHTPEIMQTNSDEIPTRTRIIVSPQPNRFTVVDFGVEIGFCGHQRIIVFGFNRQLSKSGK
jgi:hypothetical protein